MTWKGVRRIISLMSLCGMALVGCSSTEPGRPGEVLDEARRVGRTPASFPAADEDYFRGMDGGIALSPDEVKGRNMWIVWTGGDDRLWTN